MGTERFLVRSHASGWSIERNGEHMSSHGSRGEAIDLARRHARECQGELIVLDDEGHVAAESHVGWRDPRDGKA